MFTKELLPSFTSGVIDSLDHFCSAAIVNITKEFDNELDIEEVSYAEIGQRANMQNNWLWFPWMGNPWISLPTTLYSPIHIQVC